MILSKKHKFIFIKGRKVASTSIEVMLSSLCGVEDIITPITPVDEKYRLETYSIGAQNYGFDPIELEKYKKTILSCTNTELKSIQLPTSHSFFNHMSLKKLLSLESYIDDEWFIFCFERNPYSKIISFANMQLTYTDYVSTGKPMVSNKKELKKQISKNFEDESLITAVRNIDLYKDQNTNLRTKIFKYENLHNDINKILKYLNISKAPELGYFKKGLLSNSINPKEIFTCQQIHTINELFEDEFTCFNYDFIN